MASLASLGLVRGIAETASGALALASIFANVGTATAMGAGVAAGALGIAVGTVGAALNIRNLSKAHVGKKQVKQVMDHILTRHALLPGSEEEVKLGLEICNMVKRKQNEKFFGNASSLSVNTLVIAGGVAATVATATGAASMGAVPAALGGAAAALALARWVMIHRRGVEAKDRQTWLAESGQDMSTDQGLYISLYFQLKSELEVRNTLKAQGVTAPSSAVFCDEICPLLDLDPEVFVEAVEGLAANFVELMEMQRSTVVEGLMTRQTALTEGVPDPLLARRIDQLGQTGQLGGEYVAGGYKEYKSERKLQTKIEKEQTELHKLKKSDLKETGRLFAKGKTSADSKKIGALRSKRQKLSAKIERDQQQLELLKQSHRPHLRENEVRKRKSDAA